MNAAAHREDSYLHTGEIDLTNTILNADSVEELMEIGEQIFQLYDLRYFSILRAPDNDNQAYSDLVLLSNWPKDLIAEYGDRDLQRNSPIFTHTRNSTRPLAFNINAINKMRSDGLGSFATSLFSRYGAKAGVYFNVHLADGQTGIVSFLAEANQPSPTAVVELNYLANHLFLKVNELKGPSDANLYGLNAYEIDCLRWLSDGKLRSEISEILGLSETTVNLYLASAARKLAARHAEHAVSLALRNRIIS